jgi:hypothetical protein
VPVDAYALRLVSGRTLYGSDRSTTHSPSIAGLADGVCLLLNPGDRARVVAEEGADVKVSAGAAEVVLPVFDDPATPSGVAFLAVNRSGEGARDLIDAAAVVTELRVEMP